MKIEARLEEMGLVLPGPGSYQPSTQGPPVPVVVRNNIVYVSGHSARDADGRGIAPMGRAPSRASVEDAREAAKGAALTILAEIKREIGDLSRIAKWLYVTGMVAADPGIERSSYAISGFSGFIIELFDSEIGNHARSTPPGMSSLAGNSCVLVAACPGERSLAKVVRLPQAA